MQVEATCACETGLQATPRAAREGFVPTADDVAAAGRR